VVSPRSSTNTIEVRTDGTVRARVAAPPANGAANAALLRLLAEVLDLPRSRLAIIAGATGRHKRVLVTDLSPESLTRRLVRALDQSC
jgi:uncharacterized protein YggU (UPF0235/DUF167 family)